jgi:hypothetical protein
LFGRNEAVLDRQPNGLKLKLGVGHDVRQLGELDVNRRANLGAGLVDKSNESGLASFHHTILQAHPPAVQFSELPVMPTANLALRRPARGRPAAKVCDVGDRSTVMPMMMVVMAPMMVVMMPTVMVEIPVMMQSHLLHR